MIQYSRRPEQGTHDQRAPSIRGIRQSGESDHDALFGHGLRFRARLQRFWQIEMSRRSGSDTVDALAEIRRVAFPLFGRYGYDGVSIGDIAGASGLSKGALYWHFTGKSDLFLDCLARMHQIFESTVFEPMQRQENAVARTLAMFRGLDTLLEDKRVTDGIGGYWLGSSNSGSVGKIQASQQAFEQRTANVIQEALAAGMAQGVFDLEDDLEDMSRAIVAIVEAIVLPLRSQSAEDIHRILAVLARTLFRAYGTSDDVAEMARAF